MIEDKHKRFEQRLDSILEVAEKAIELGQSNSIMQKITTNNISRLEKTVENVIEGSPRIAILEVGLERVGKILTRLLWSASAGAISLIIYLSTHNIIIE